MTELGLYNVALIEQNKQEAPTLLIEEYNYLINKAIMQYINLTYARFDLNQQASDDLRWLQKSIELPVFKQAKIIQPAEEANYAVQLPSDYLHILNCTTLFKKKSCVNDDSKKCPTDDDADNNVVFSLCRRLTANQYPAIIQNAYLKPTYKRPYFYITDSMESESASTLYSTKSPDCGDVPEYVEPDYTNPCEVGDDRKIMEIRCGKNKLYCPTTVYVDYLRKPKEINLTWEQVQSVEDTTLNCEFPDAVAYEIVNIFMKLLFENASDPRLQSHFAINQTVGGIPTTESSKK